MFWKITLNLAKQRVWFTHALQQEHSDAVHHHPDWWLLSQHVEHCTWERTVTRLHMPTSTLGFTNTKIILQKVKQIVAWGKFRILFVYFISFRGFLYCDSLKSILQKHMRNETGHFRWPPFLLKRLSNICCGRTSINKPYFVALSYIF